MLRLPGKQSPSWTPEPPGPRVRAYTWRVEDPADDPESLAEAIAELERREFRVECAALAEWMRRRERDDYLREAYGLMSGAPWGRCVQLAAEIHRFEALVWPRWRDRAAPPEPCSALRRHLFEARRLGQLPTSARQLRNIAKWNGHGDFREKAFSSPPTPESGTNDGA